MPEGDSRHVRISVDILDAYARKAARRLVDTGERVAVKHLMEADLRAALERTEGVSQ